VDPHEMLNRVETMASSVGAAVLATVDERGRPRTRWMTPAVLPGRRGAIYTITSPHAAKTTELAANPQVEWLFQEASLNEVIHLRGPARLVEDAALKAKVMAAIGDRLTVFWRINPGTTEFVVLETTVEEIEHFLPMKGRKERVRLTATTGPK